MTPQPLGALQIGTPVEERVRIDGLPRGHSATVHVKVEGAAQLADGSSEADVPVRGGFAVISVRATDAGSVTLRYTLHVLIPGYWEAGG